METFFAEKPYPHFSVGKFETETWEWVERFQIRRHPPLRWGVILGDVVHNLRSALDHMIWQVTLLDGGTPDDATQYPIASKSESQFESMMADRRIPGLSEKHRAMVKKTQPYHRGNRAENHSLSVLATPSNTDKHRALNASYSFMETDARETLDKLVRTDDNPDSPVVGFFMARRGTRMKHGTPWFRILWDRAEDPPRSVEMGGDLRTGIGFGEIGLDASDFRKIAEDVLTIIEAFMRDFPETTFTDE